jgi:uncharacterized protein
MQNPCQRCGACCAFYKVALQYSETNDQPGGRVPVELTFELPDHKRVMKGTERFMQKRCAALEGTVGVNVACRVYDQRPSNCRSFPGSWEFKSGGNPLCDRARAVYGMVPFGDY